VVIPDEVTLYYADLIKRLIVCKSADIDFMEFEEDLKNLMKILEKK